MEKREDKWRQFAASLSCVYLQCVVKLFSISAPGSTWTDFGPQLKSLNKERFTVVGWDPRGYGQSRPPDRDFPLDFFERDAKDAVDLMQVQSVCCELG